MSTKAPRSELIPDPPTLAALVAQLVEGTWPRSDDERKNLFRRLLLTSGERLDQNSDGSPSATFRLSTELPGNVFASWSTYNGKLISIDFHLYTFPEPEAPATRAGHDAVWGILTGLYGQPTRPWEHEEVPPSIWKANGREIVTHFFNRRDSALMLSISDAVLSAAAAEESHDARNPDSTEPSP